jgi:hypothetical protein
MIATSSDDPILLLHSSCTEDDEATASSEWDNTTNVENRADNSGPDISKQPMFCDLLLMPEFDDSYGSSSNHDYVHFPKNPLNPCGVSNVLTLENLPERWVPSPVLLSLTSCSIFYRNGDDGDDEYETSILLPVVANPSSFVLDFYTSKESGDNSEREEGENEKFITTAKTMTEITVEFDVREASRQAKRLLFPKKISTRTESGEDKGSFMSEEDPKSAPDDPQHDRRPRFKDISRGLYSDELFARKDVNEQKLLLAHLSSQLEQGTRTIDLICFVCGFFCIFLMAILLWTIYQYYRTTFKSDKFNREIRESMKKTHDFLRMAVDELSEWEHENRKEHHLSIATDRHQPEYETEASMAIKLDAEDQENSVTVGDRSDNESKSAFATSSTDTPTQNKAIRGNQNFVLGSEGRKELERKKPHAISSTRDDIGVNNRTRDNPAEDVITRESNAEREAVDATSVDEMEIKYSMGKAVAPFQLPEVPYLPEKKGGKKLYFLRSSSSLPKSPLRNSETKRTNNYNSPPSSLVNEWNDEKKTYRKKDNAVEVLIPGKKCNNAETKFQPGRLELSAPLSPCSQLSEQWNNGKTIRRANLKKRRPVLKPLSQPDVASSSISANNICNDDVDKTLFESTILSRMPKTSKLQSRYFEQQELACTISGPPKLRSTARSKNLADDTNIEHLFAEEVAKDHEGDGLDKQRKMLDVLKTPPSNTIMPNPPPLCFTPASEDDSFVDDYW